MTGDGITDLKPWLVAASTALIATYPIGARDENMTLPAGITRAEEFARPFRESDFAPRPICFARYPVRSAGENHVISSPQYEASFVEGVPPDTTSPISAIDTQHHEEGTSQRRSVMPTVPRSSHPSRPHILPRTGHTCAPVPLARQRGQSPDPRPRSGSTSPHDRGSFAASPSGHR